MVIIDDLPVVGSTGNQTAFPIKTGNPCMIKVFDFPNELQFTLKDYCALAGHAPLQTSTQSQMRSHDCSINMHIKITVAAYYSWN